MTGWYSDIPGYYGDNSGTLTVDLYEEVFANHPPVLVAPADRRDVEDIEVSLMMQASDPDGDALTFSAVGLPDGVQIDAVTGLISGWLNPTSAGVYHPMVTVTDDRGATTTAAFNWAVTDHNHDPYIIAAAPTTPFAVGQTISGLPFFTATDPDGDPLTVTVENLPNWLTFDRNTGTVSGTVAEAGTVTVKVVADDGHGGVGSEIFPLLTASSPYAYFTTQGPLATFVNPGMPLTLGVAFTSPNPNDTTEYLVEVKVSGNNLGTVDQPVVSMKNGETTTVTYTPTSVSKAYNDINITLRPLIGRVSPVTAQMQVVNVEVTLPNINARTTPTGMRPRVPLAAMPIDPAAPPGFDGLGRMTPWVPGGVVNFVKNLPASTANGDFQLAVGPPLPNFGGGVARFSIVVNGTAPTLPSLDPQGKPDYQARNADGLWVIPIINNPGGAVISPYRSNKFSVATIPIAVEATKSIAKNGSEGVGEQYFVGADVTLIYKYDGVNSFNFNWIGEQLFANVDGTLIDSSRLVKEHDNEYPASNSNATLALNLEFIDANGETPVGKKAADAQWDLAQKAVKGIKRYSPLLDQYFDFVNLAVDDVSVSNKFPSNPNPAPPTYTKSIKAEVLSWQDSDFVRSIAHPVTRSYFRF